MRVVDYLLRNNLVTPDQLGEALQHQRESRPPLGILAHADRAMSARDVNVVLDWQRTEAWRPFGEIALEFGYLNEERLDRLLRIQGYMTRPVARILCEMGALDELTADSIMRCAPRTPPPGKPQ